MWAKNFNFDVTLDLLDFSQFEVQNNCLDFGHCISYLFTIFKVIQVHLWRQICQVTTFSPKEIFHSDNTKVPF